MGDIEASCEKVNALLKTLDPNTITSVLTGVLALHLSQKYDSHATEAFDMEYAPAIKALITYHRRGKIGLQ